MDSASSCLLSSNWATSCLAQFICEDGSGDYIARVDEPQSCRYVLTVHTSRTCQHPFLRPPSTAKPQSIVCQPALSAQQYMEYVKAQVCELTTLLIRLYVVRSDCQAFCVAVIASRLHRLWAVLDGRVAMRQRVVFWRCRRSYVVATTQKHQLGLILQSCHCCPAADTKRKVEQISEELRSLDEMLAANEDTDGTEGAAADAASPTPRDDSDRAGTCRLGPFISLKF